jgi:UDP-glucose 4-epimerase
MKKVIVTGAAGFIGSNLVDFLLKSGAYVIGIDNMSIGSAANLFEAKSNENFKFYNIDLSDASKFHELVDKELLRGSIEELWHLAANSNIPAGVYDPKIDLKDTFMTTFNVLQLMKEYGIPNLLFASTSAVYGESKRILEEDFGPLLPISNYGAMKLASEAIISSASESYLKKIFIFRFPNVVGPRLTHGAIFDFVNKLKNNKDELEVLGDGSQTKPYLHVSSLLDAMFFVQKNSKNKVNVYNIGPQDSGISVDQMARLVIEKFSPGASIKFTGGDRGWIGDVPMVNYSVNKLKEFGWKSELSSLDSVSRAIDQHILG